MGINVEADRIFCNDQITYLIGMFGLFRETETEVLLTRIRGLIAAYQLTQQNKEGYLELRRHYNESKDLTELFVLTCYAFNHQIRFNNSHEFNSPFGTNRSSFNGNIEKNLTAFCRALKEKDIVFSTTGFPGDGFGIPGRKRPVFTVIRRISYPLAPITMGTADSGTGTRRRRRRS